MNGQSFEGLLKGGRAGDASGSERRLRQMEGEDYAPCLGT
jgi:hypothetical protein